MLGTIFDSDVERRDETPAFLGEQKYDLAVLAGIRLTLAAAWDENEVSRRPRQAGAEAAPFRPEGKRPALSIRPRPGVRIAHIGDVDAPEVGRIARDFRKCGEENGADLSV